jgi:hypothetical protein
MQPSGCSSHAYCEKFEAQRERWVKDVATVSIGHQGAGNIVTTVTAAWRLVKEGKDF